MPKSKKEDETTKKSSLTKSKKTATKTAAKKTATKTVAKKTATKTSEKKTSTKKTESKSTNKVVEISDDGFNWTEFEEGIQTISKKQIDEFDKLIDQNFVDTYT